MSKGIHSRPTTHDPRLNILFCSAEVAPFSKTGGLGEVAGALPQALGRLGHEVLVMTPKYRGIRARQKTIAPRVRVRFIENDLFFDRDGLYGNNRGDYRDNLERFAWWARMALVRAREEGFRPDVVHGHDWHAGLVFVYLKTLFKNDPFFAKTRGLLTIHNLAYQGVFERKMFDRIIMPAGSLTTRGALIWGRGNLMKAGLVYTDAVSTVSPTYAREILTRRHGCGLQRVLRRRRPRGILNGIDTRLWDPARDRRLWRRFTARSAGKRIENKVRLQKTLGLASSGKTALFGMVSRLAEQKGFDILQSALGRLMKRDAQMVILGTGDAKAERFWARQARRYRGRLAFCARFDEKLAARIYGASDFFLMPSRFEPCGLGQFIALRYGAVPVVRRTGGLSDSVFDYARDSGRGNGVVFASYTASGLLKAVDRALRLYGRGDRLARLRRRFMREDHSWDRSAAQYVRVYRRLARAGGR